MGRALLVLGGCGGIGRTLVREASDHGYEVCVMDTPASLSAHPPQAAAFAVDARSESSMKSACSQACEKHGPFDGFVNLCGYLGAPDPLVSVTPEDWNDVVQGNLTAAWLSARCCAEALAPGAAMVIVGSGLGAVPKPGYGAYAVAKAGMVGLTRLLARELAPKLRVNCVAPGPVDTAFLTGGTGRSDEQGPSRVDLEAHAAQNPLGRVATPEDVVGPIVFLLSPQASYVTGQTWYINGGTYCG